MLLRHTKGRFGEFRLPLFPCTFILPLYLQENHFLRNTKNILLPSSLPFRLLGAKQTAVVRASAGAGGGTRRRGLLCPVHMSSAAPATPTGPTTRTATDAAAARSTVKTTAARALAARAPASIIEINPPIEHCRFGCRDCVRVEVPSLACQRVSVSCT